MVCELRSGGQEGISHVGGKRGSWAKYWSRVRRVSAVPGGWSSIGAQGWSGWHLWHIVWSALWVPGPCQPFAGSMALQAASSLGPLPFIDIIPGLLLPVLFMDHTLLILTTNQYSCVSHSVVSGSLWPHGPQPCQVSLSMEFSRQEYWSGLPFPSSGDLTHPGIEPGSPALLSEPPGKPDKIMN